jgi:hypothetical protein
VMSPKTVAFWSVLLPLLPLAPGIRPEAPAPAHLQLTVATLHAAGLTTPRTPDDAVDQPYLLVSTIGPGSNAATSRLPEAGHLTVHRDEAVGAQPLLGLRLEPGDTVRFLLSLLEGPQIGPVEETHATASAASALAAAPEARAGLLADALRPVTGAGAHWLGSVTLLVTSRGGTLTWGSLECLVTCKVLTTPAGSARITSAAAPLAAVLEFSGAGGTYHLKLEARQVP